LSAQTFEDPGPVPPNVPTENDVPFTNPFTFKEDFDADGYGDILITNQEGFTYSVMLTGQDGNEWKDWSWVNAPQNYTVLASYYHNGAMNLIVKSKEVGQEWSFIINLTGDRNTEWGGWHWINIPKEFTVKAVSDLNSDGKIDLVVEDQNQDKFIIYLTGDNNNAWLDYVWVNIPKHHEVRGIGHFNTDYKADLVVQDKNTGSKYIVFLTGENNNQWLDWTWVNAPQDMDLKGTADLNADGTRDLIVEDAEGSKYVVFLQGDLNNEWLDWAWINLPQDYEVTGPTPTAIPAPPAS